MLFFDDQWDILNMQVPLIAWSLSGLINIKFWRVKWRTLRR